MSRGLPTQLQRLEYLGILMREEMGPLAETFVSVHDPALKRFRELHYDKVKNCHCQWCRTHQLARMLEECAGYLQADLKRKWEGSGR